MANTSAVCRLKKSLYRLKQAPRAWNAMITQQLRRMGFATSKSDSSLFIRKGRLGPVSILLYDDDLVITGADLGMADCKSVSTPLDRTVKLCPDSGKVCEPTRFRQIVESLIYLTITRTDLSYSVGLISQVMVRTTEEHLQCAQCILRYVGDTKDRGVLYIEPVFPNN